MDGITSKNIVQMDEKSIKIGWRAPRQYCPDQILAKGLISFLKTDLKYYPGKYSPQHFCPSAKRQSGFGDRDEYYFHGALNQNLGKK